jgi:hypothetical protein
MGRNSGGNNTSGVPSVKGGASSKRSETMSVASIGLTPSQALKYGGKEYIGGLVETYNASVKSQLKTYRKQLNSVETLTDKQRASLERTLAHYEKHKELGQKDTYAQKLRKDVKRVESGDFDKKLLSAKAALSEDVVFGYANSRAMRLMLPEIRKKLKKK